MENISPHSLSEESIRFVLVFFTPLSTMLPSYMNTLLQRPTNKSFGRVPVSVLYAFINIAQTFLHGTVQDPTICNIILHPCARINFKLSRLVPTQDIVNLHINFTEVVLHARQLDHVDVCQKFQRCPDILLGCQYVLSMKVSADSFNCNYKIALTGR